MKEQTQALEHASVKQYCKALRVPVIGANFVSLAEQAVKEKRNHIGYLEALLTMEAEERDRHAIQKRLHDAHLPRMKTLEEFDFNQASQIPAAKIRELAEGGYIERAEPVVLMGECGTGKTHLATGLSHHPPMHTKLLRDRPNRTRSVRVFPPNLFEQLHLASPVHRPPRPLRKQGR